MKKIIISDYDRTLYIDEESLLKNIEEIKKFRDSGNLFVIATGRSYQSLKIELDKYSIPFDYIILNNGAVILDKDNKLILSCEIEKDIIKKILKEIKRFSNAVDGTRLFDTFYEGVKINTENLTKLRILTKTYEDAKKITKDINNNFDKEVKSYAMNETKYGFVEVISINTDKGKAIENLLEIENLNEYKVHVIGDSSNDIEMIEKYKGYGMINSVESILNIATRLYGNVYDLIKEIK